MKLKVKRLTPSAILPAYATAGAACFDLYADMQAKYPIIREWVHSRRDADIGTGLAFEIPAGHVMLIFSRSGHGFKHGVRLANCVGVIDSDYRGEVRVKLVCDDLQQSIAIDHGMRIAQAMVVPLPSVEIEEASSLSDTARGAGGFGSTGS